MRRLFRSNPLRALPGAVRVAAACLAPRRLPGGSSARRKR